MSLTLTNPFDPAQLPGLFQTILMASLVNVACALVGVFLVLRRMSMMGDAISHAVLPGLVVAFLFSESLSVVPLFLGAIAAGLATTYLTQTLHQYGRLATDTSMGVVFTSLFAIGVLLVKQYASQVHFDTACIYEGNLLLLTIDTITLAGLELPRQALVVGPVMLLNAVVLGVLWKEFKLTTFDAGLATSMGFSAGIVHYLLMTLVALTAVVSFKAVGSILVVAMLIVPGAAAQLLVKRLAPLVLVACVLGALIAAVGVTLAVAMNVSPAGMMAVVAGGVYTAAALFSPQNGVLMRLIFHQQTAERIVREDLLAMLYRVEELDAKQTLARDDALEAVGGGWTARRALRSLLGSGQMVQSPAGLTLTPAGREAASQMVRTHRLWESYLVEHLGLPLDHVHDPAHRVEHFLGEELREQLAETLPQTSEDPHGREIPE